MSSDEEGFSRLKGELNLNFEFHSIEKKIVDLIKQCISADKQREESNQHESFIAKLVMNNNEGELRFVKNDSFREIPIFSLNIRAGNDTAVKDFLASEVIRLKAENRKLSEAKETNEDALTRKLLKTEQELEVLREKNGDLVNHYERQINATKMDYQNTITSLKEKHIREMQDLTSDHLRQKRQLEDNLQAQIKELRSKNNELIEQNKQISETKSEIESNYRVLNQSQLKDTDQHQFQITALNQKVKDKEELISSLQRSLDEAKLNCRDLEKRIASHDYDIKSREETYVDLERKIKKANEIIIKFDAELKAKRLKATELRKRAIEFEHISKKLEDKIAKLEHKTKSLKEKHAQQLKTIHQQIEYKQQDIEESQKMIKRLEDQKDSLTNENTRLNQVVRELLSKQDKDPTPKYTPTFTSVMPTGTATSRPTYTPYSSTLSTPTPPISSTFAPSVPISSRKATPPEPEIANNTRRILPPDTDKLAYTKFS